MIISYPRYYVFPIMVENNYDLEILDKDFRGDNGYWEKEETLQNFNLSGEKDIFEELDEEYIEEYLSSKK